MRLERTAMPNTKLSTSLNSGKIPRPQLPRYGLTLYTHLRQSKRGSHVKIKSSLQSMMMYEDKLEEFKEFLFTTRTEATKYLELSQEIQDQDASAVSKVKRAVYRQHRELGTFEDLWPIEAYLRQWLYVKAHHICNVAARSKERVVEPKCLEYVGKPPPHLKTSPLKRGASVPPERPSKRQWLEPKANTNLETLHMKLPTPRSDTREKSLPVLRFLLELHHPSEDLLPHFERFGIKDGPTLLAFFRMAPKDRNPILEKWVKEEKITEFQSKILELALNERYKKMKHATSLV